MLPRLLISKGCSAQRNKRIHFFVGETLSQLQSFRMANDDSTRMLRLIGGIAAFLAVLGIVALVFWWLLRMPRF